MVSTAGGVAFVGDFDRPFKAVDVKTGRIVWETRLGNTVQGYPISLAWAASNMSPSPPAWAAAACSEADRAAQRGAPPPDRQHALRLRATDD